MWHFTMQLVSVVVLGQRLDLIDLEVFFNTNVYGPIHLSYNIDFRKTTSTD